MNWWEHRRLHKGNTDFFWQQPVIFSWGWSHFIKLFEPSKANYLSNVLISCNLAELCFPSFPLIYIKEKERWMRFLQKRHLLIHIQNEPCSYKGNKTFKFRTKNAKFGYFRHVLSLISQRHCQIVNILKFIKIQSFMQKGENFKFWTKNTLLRYIWICKFERLLPHLKSLFSDFSKSKVSSKILKKWN